MNRNYPVDKVETVPLNIKCPVCYKNNLNMIYTVTKIPYLGEILVMSIKCTSCNFKVSDMMLISHTGKNIMHEKITSETMNDLVVLSAESSVSIPELGIEIETVTETGGEITTIEGILREFIGYLKQLLNSDLNTKELEIVRTLKNKISSELNNPTGTLTLRINDKTGKSSIIPHKLWTKKAEEERETANVDKQKIMNLAKEKIEKYRQTKNGGNQ